MKSRWLNGQGGHFVIRHPDPGLIAVPIESCLDFQSLPGRGAYDQIHHDFPTDQGTSSPVGRDVAEHSVLDLVPLARSRRNMAHLDRNREFIGQLLELAAPQANPVPIAASPVSVMRSRRATG